jgi:RNA polymerase sigma-70 factor (ECF subfamily)
MQYSDEQLVQQFLAGDEKAFEKLVEKYLKPLYNFIFQLVRDKDTANDITQDVFVKIWKKISLFDEQKKFSTWIFAIAKNTAFDFLKKKKTVPFTAFENENGENFLEFIEDKSIPHSDELLRLIDEKKDVANFLDSLSPQMKTVLLLHHVHGFSLAEISEIMGHSHNTIKSKYRRAIIFLREQISSKKAVQM